MAKRPLNKDAPRAPDDIADRPTDERFALARNLADATSDAVLLCDRRGIIQYANSAALRLFDSNEELLAHADLRSLVPGCPAELTCDAPGYDWATRVSMPGRGLLEINVNLRVLDPPQRTILALVAARPRLEHIMTSNGSTDSETMRWTLAAQGSTDGFWHRPDVGRDESWWSPRVYQMLGHEPGDIEPSFSEIVQRLHPRDREHFLDTRAQDLQRGEPFDTQVRLRHNNGEYRHFRIRALVTRGSDSRPLALSGSIQDVTELHNATLALKANQERMRDIAAAASDFFFELDENLRVIWLSENFHDMTGRNPEDLIGQKIESLQPQGGDKQQWLKYLELMNKRLPFRDLIQRHVGKSGRVRYFSRNGVPVFNADGDFRGYRSSAIDVTARMNTETALLESEARFKAVIEHAPLEIYVKDSTGRYLVANPQLLKAWNRPAEDVIGRTVSEVWDKQTTDRVSKEDREILQTNEPIIGETTVLRNDASREIYRIKFPIPGDGDRPNGVASIRYDATERKRARLALEKSERRFRDFTELAADYFWETDEAFRLTFVSDGFKRVNGFEPDEMLGKDYRNVFVQDCDNKSMLTRYEKNLAARRALQIEWNRIRHDGKKVRVFVRAQPLHNSNGDFVGYRGIARDITESWKLSAQLAYQATHDSLTGLVNRRELEGRLERLLQSARKNGSSHALCFLDLDQFKVVNDTCGHSAGDALLERLAETLTFRVRQRDTVARMGGDEFAILIEHCTVERAMRVVNNLQDSLSDFVFNWEDRQFQVGASMGLVPITPEFGDITEILRAADSACYMAKEQGRNRVQVYSEDDADLARRRGEMDWVSHISGALAEDRFRLRLQPVLSISDSQPNVQHGELLVNMITRDGEVIPPNAFLPAAERYNLAARIDRWVLSRALSWLAHDDDGRGRPEICAVNLSAQSLGEVGFLEFVRSECRRFKVPASQLCFEITETAAIANLETAIRFIHALKNDGARFALDDFGKGLSSFGYLRTLPVDYIKIDAQFVRDVVSDPIDRAMVRSINEVARIMDIRTIAEGVESNEVLGVLREIGVDLAQGYAIGTPQFIDQVD